MQQFDSDNVSLDFLFSRVYWGGGDPLYNRAGRVICVEEMHSIFVHVFMFSFIPVLI